MQAVYEPQSVSVRLVGRSVGFTPPYLLPLPSLPTVTLPHLSPLSVAGFIDFIVDPSFQVMGDMLEKIIEPMQRRNACTISEEGDDAVVDKATSTTSITSSSSSSSTPKSPSPGLLSPCFCFLHDVVPQLCHGAQYQIS